MKKAEQSKEKTSVQAKEKTVIETKEKVKKADGTRIAPKSVEGKKDTEKKPASTKKQEKLKNPVTKVHKK